MCRVKPYVEVILKIRGLRWGDSQVQHEPKFIMNQTYVYISQGIWMGTFHYRRKIHGYKVPFKYTNEFSLSALGMEDKDRECILMKRRLGVKWEWCVWDSNSNRDVWCPCLLDVKILVKFLDGYDFWENKKRHLTPNFSSSIEAKILMMVMHPLYTLNKYSTNSLCKWRNIQDKFEGHLVISR